MAIIKSLEDAAALFPSFKELNFLITLFSFLEKYGLLCVEVEFYIAILGLLLTLCHVFVLTRKPMMTSSIISIMIGMGIYDALSMIFAISVKDLIYNFYRDECTPPFTFAEFVIFLLLAHSRENMMRSSTWLGLVMALFRFLALRFASKPGILKISKICYGFIAAFITFLVSCVLTFFNVFRSKLVESGKWTAGEKCNLEFDNDYIIYRQQISEVYNASNQLLLRILTFVNAISTKVLIDESLQFVNFSQILPSLLLPIFTILLIIEIRKARKKITNASSHVQKRTDKTTYLVIFMTTTFFIASLPAGIFSLFQVMYSDEGFIYLSSLVDHFCSVILTVNASVHCIICFVMSTDYRKQTKMILGIQPKKINTNSIF
ncbi:hypothetical protein CAEBREN_12032 [Caenorhabditis brenneri]|uniref:G-protein coupled receptors family 1 profile domain-containing protein n=1 Tax=Caenorhabditis brenneri TaxID=135651 RepID=G0P0I3_CAEBE|nr:hypothetical protein CAEBREN_12032 [Caenorhabditis brenneri]